MRTQLICLALPGVGAVVLFGISALKLIAVATITAILVDAITGKIRPSQKQPGNATHSIMMGLLLAFTLPAHCSWYIAMIGSAIAVAIGKSILGRLGCYRWHPALIGRLFVQVFFYEQLSFSSASWAVPLEALRHWRGVHFVDAIPQMGQYLLGNLPPLEQCIYGSVPGGIGETCRLLLILLGVYLIYRGYVHWQMPLVFIASACTAAALCPIVIASPADAAGIIYCPVIAESLTIGLTYVSYHLFTGGLILAACIIAADMTSRPITVKGQIFFAAAAGLLTVILRLYSPITIPAYAAILIMNTLTPTIDRFTRPQPKHLP